MQMGGTKNGMEVECQDDYSDVKDDDGEVDVDSDVDG